MAHHLVLYIHGMWGRSTNLDRVSTMLNSSLENHPDTIHPFAPTNFSSFKTYDGVENLGNYVIASLFEELDRLHNDGITITKISIVGYSLGGLIGRYVIGQLESAGFFDTIKPILFTTFATPHLGVKFYTYGGFFRNFLGSRLLGQTGRDLFVSEGYDSILFKMTELNSIYVKGISKFKKIFTIANIKNDRTVPFFTSYITKYNFSKHMNKLKLGMFKGFPSAQLKDLNYVEMNLVDFENSIESTDVEKEETRYALILLMAFIGFFFPIVFLVSAISSIRSNIRVNSLPEFNIVKEWELTKSVLENKKNINIHQESSHENLFRKAEHEISDITRDIIEDGVILSESESIKSGVESYIDSDTGEYDYEIDVPFAISCPSLKETVKKFENSAKNIQLDNSQICNSMELLPFDNTRLQMCDNLNKLPWLKLAVSQDSINAHQSIVARRGFGKTNQSLSLLWIWSQWAGSVFDEDS